MNNKVTTEAVLAYLMYARYSYVINKKDVELNFNVINGILKSFNLSTDITLDDLFKSNSNFELRGEFVLTHIGFDKLKKIYENNIDSKVLDVLDKKYQNN